MEVKRNTKSMHMSMIWSRRNINHVGEVSGDYKSNPK